MTASIALLAFVAATTRWVSWHDAIYKFQSYDDLSYRAMAAAAPGLLHHRIPEWHAERFAVEWVVGSAAKLFNLSIVTSFRVGNVLVMIAICLVLAELLVRIRLSLSAAVVCMAVFILNAYTLHPYLMAPGGVADLVFILGAAISIRGLVLRAPASVLAGLLLATISRQTALPAAAVCALVIGIDPCWRARVRGAWLPLAVAAIALPLACYAVIRVVAHPFSGPAPSLDAMTLLGARSFSGVVVNWGRCIEALLSVGALLIVAGGIRRAVSTAGGTHPALTDRGATGAIYACLAYGAAVILQPFAMNPHWIGGNGQRLAMLGLVPIIVAVALIGRQLELESGRRLAPQVAAALVGLLGIASFSYIYTAIGPSNKVETFVLEALVAVALAMILWRSSRMSFARR